MKSAGFQQAGGRDVTAAYLATTRAWLEMSERHADALIAVDGADLIRERMQGWRDAIAALERGWLRRTLYWATRP